ncbi:hypothetical protein GH714_013215 [Hevea brasiliensis]|uniref:Uncharacterized protein n=1 Tax=Hevea brasiliensis TaxID=3981 RepID=A0A6A6LXG5_HEVBR|nr:hypothetical protein GH714_013215 [Hevea brasiliensis]
MGRNRVLITFDSKDQMNGLLKRIDCVNYWLSEVKPWDAVLSSVARVVWVRLYGVPFHVWDIKFFKWLGNKFGSFAKRDNVTGAKSCFDSMRILIQPCEDFSNSYVPWLCTTINNDSSSEQEDGELGKSLGGVVIANSNALISLHQSSDIDLKHTSAHLENDVVLVLPILLFLVE